MTRTLSVLAAVAVLAVSAAPVASAGHSKAIIYNGHAGLGANSNHSADEGRGINASGGWDPTLRTVQGRGAHVIASLGVKYTAEARDRASERRPRRGLSSLDA